MGKSDSRPRGFRRGTVLSTGLRLTIILAAAAVPVPPAFTQPLQRFEFSELAMGGRARIVVYVADAIAAESACRAAFQRIASLEDIYSDYRPDSELMRLCAASGGPPVRVSRELIEVLLQARELSEASGGAFDVTVGPLVRLWRAARKSGVLPDADVLAAARRRTGFRKVVVDADRGTVRLVEPGMLLDLGGIAKGRACDEALAVLRAAGITAALVEMGGDIALGDPPPDSTGWVIELPYAPGRQRFLTLSNAGVSTSGDTEQFVEIDGVRYSHVVDPRTGLGLTDRMVVTVTAPNAATSDALSTAVRVLGELKGRELVCRFEGARIVCVASISD